jgi:hypothetical protein
MPTFRRWPLFDHLVAKYWTDEGGWLHVQDWDSQDLGWLESFANAELQRRGESHDRRVGRTVH